MRELRVETGGDGMSVIGRKCLMCGDHMGEDPESICPTCGYMRGGGTVVLPMVDDEVAELRRQLMGAVDLLRRAEPYVRAARHSSGVHSASALADEIANVIGGSRP